MGCGASTSVASETADTGPTKPMPAGLDGAPVDPASLLFKRIIINGLERREDLNGKPAVVEHFIVQRSRFICKVEDSDETVSIEVDKVRLAG
mmetsp:Transcript_18245/g.34746  ORF Transcript_18245/g.34746 Transcript_18245/m.34746 type:complete len:92 (-) Transcript_18245:612-887(-)|eukprot:CAMPEP_0114272558 /NCGR_PEP_ID=MMETSP0058-20121206/28550_1 /TAXON_ID=36894 /ORGANISM="Pyramimonas parkeae, CCMP726" /LENGTH=91 /DNA_ID=CAMNT_0001391799 /DNA_START=78 /DNA_END=353 /DNA_ORIENTATION=+